MICTSFLTRAAVAFADWELPGALCMLQGGMKGMFCGVGPRALSNGINSAVFFCFFEVHCCAPFHLLLLCVAQEVGACCAVRFEELPGEAQAQVNADKDVMSKATPQPSILCQLRHCAPRSTPARRSARPWRPWRPMAARRSDCWPPGLCRPRAAPPLLSLPRRATRRRRPRWRKFLTEGGHDTAGCGQQCERGPSRGCIDDALPRKPLVEERHMCQPAAVVATVPVPEYTAHLMLHLHGKVPHCESERQSDFSTFFPGCPP